jgi:hypothetical protein
MTTDIEPLASAQPINASSASHSLSSRQRKAPVLPCVTRCSGERGTGRNSSRTGLNGLTVHYIRQPRETRMKVNGGVATGQ